MEYNAGRIVTEDTHDLEAEAAADQLLSWLPDDPDCPFMSEFQLMRHRREGRIRSFEGMEESIAGETGQDALDELRFLIAVTPLSARERACLRGWVLGCSQQETQRLWWNKIPPCSQQAISKALMRGLLKCFTGCELTFRQFCKHTVYRRPARRERQRMRVCPHCAEEFCYGLGAGRFCCTACGEAATRRG